MHISVEPSGKSAILHLRGEFDTFYCPLLEKEIQAALGKGSENIVLNLRLVKYINSTALGSILKASKTVKGAGGTLVIAHPSPFCKDILGKVGLDRIIPVFDNDDAALESLSEGDVAAADGDAEMDIDPASLIFRPLDRSRIDHFLEKATADNPLHGHAFGKNWSGIGRMAALSESDFRFTWSGGKTGLSPFEMGQLLAVGTGLSVKFRLPLLQRGFCEANADVTELEERKDEVKVRCQFQEIDDETRAAINQYAKDLDFLRTELKKATE